MQQNVTSPWFTMSHTILCWLILHTSVFYLRRTTIGDENYGEYCTINNNDPCLRSHIWIIIFPKRYKGFLNGLWGRPAKSVLRSASFIVCTGHSAPTKRLLTDNRPGRFIIYVEIVLCSVLRQFSTVKILGWFAISVFESSGHKVILKKKHNMSFI